MEIVIKLHEKDFESIKKGYLPFGAIADAIKNGTPLPEKHGRLIDADALYEKSRLCHTEEDGTACVEWREINDAPTIIDGSESE